MRSDMGKTTRAILKRTIILFVLLTILSVNLIFWYLANKTFSGVITDDAYQKGLHYNGVIEEERLQNANIKGSIFQQRNNHKQINFHSSKNCDKVDFTLFSTTQSNVDFSTTMIASTSEYRWDLPEDITGPWLVRVRCYVDGEKYYFSKKLNFY